MATLINLSTSIHNIFSNSVASAFPVACCGDLQFKLLEHYLSRLKDYWIFVDKWSRFSPCS